MNLHVSENSSYFCSQENTRIFVDNSSNTVTVFFNDQIALLVMRHLKSKSLLRAGKVNFLGFYILEFKGLSSHTHGLLGMLILIAFRSYFWQVFIVLSLITMLCALVFKLA